MEPTVVTNEELKTIQAMQSEFTQAKVALGEIELHRQGLLKNIELLRAEFSAHEKKLIDKYGEDAVINVQTGEITRKQK